MVSRDLERSLKGVVLKERGSFFFVCPYNALGSVHTCVRADCAHLEP